MVCRNLDLPGWTGCKAAALAALLLASACGADETEKGDETAPPPAATEENSAAPEEAAPSREIRTPAVEEESSAGVHEQRKAGYFRLAWSGDGLCRNVADVLNERHAVSVKTSGYAEAQARSLLGTGHNVEWTSTGEGVEGATLDYFNDGVNRMMERRRGMLAGNQIITLWVEDNRGGFTKLEYGHAGANTADMPAFENLNTRLIYSVADVADIDGRYVTLVAPLEDIDSSGVVFAISWQAKDGTAPPRDVADYYSIIACVMTPTQSAE
jgi:hypothetical protein